MLLENRHADVAVDAASSTVVIAVKGHPQSIRTDGFGSLPGDPCLVGECAVRGLLAVQPDAIDAGDDGTTHVYMVFSFDRGTLSPAGVLVVAPGADASMCHGVGADARCIVLHNPLPLIGRMDFQERSFRVAGEFISKDAKVGLDLRGRIKNRPPTAEAGMDQHVACVDVTGARVTLDGSRSADPEGDRLKAVWQVVAGPLVANRQALGPTPVFREGIVVGRDLRVDVALPPGSHELQLVVFDASMMAARDTVRVSVGPEGCSGWR